MGFDKRYPNRKDKRKAHHGGKAIDKSCRPGGDCPWCRGNRTYSDRRRQAEADGRSD